MTIRPASLEDLTYRLTPSGVTKHGSITAKREEWLWNGQLYSFEDHPSVIINDGEELQWHTHGMRHRNELLGPAWSKVAEGCHTYYAMGEMHRNLGPAMIMPDSEKWYKNGKLHRADGPAVHRFKESQNTRFELVYEWAWQGSNFGSLDAWAEFSKCDPELHVLLKLQYA